MKPFLLIVLTFLFADCAVLKPPFHTSKASPIITLETSQVLPAKLFLKLRVHAPLRVGTHIDVFRATDDEDFEPWKSIKVADFEDELQMGLIIVDSKLAYGEGIFYQARSATDDSIFVSDEISFLKGRGPTPPANLRTISINGAVKIEWDPSEDFSHVIIYRRNIVEDSPIEQVSNLVKGSAWIDDSVAPNGVYTYQIVAARLEQSAIQYGSFSEPLYVTIENEKDL